MTSLTSRYFGIVLAPFNLKVPVFDVLAELVIVVQQLLGA